MIYLKSVHINFDDKKIKGNQIYQSLGIIFIFIFIFSIKKFFLMISWSNNIADFNTIYDSFAANQSSSNIN